MLTWLSAHTGDILVLAILVAIVTGIIVTMVRNKKKGKPSCGGNCENCGGCCSYKKDSEK